MELQRFSVVKCFMLPWQAAIPSVVLLPLGLTGREGTVGQQGKVGQAALQGGQEEAYRT